MHAAILLLALAADPAAKPEIRLANAAPEIPFGMSIILDTTPSANIHQIGWSVHPEKFEGNLIDLGGGRTLFSCIVPGKYVFFGAASNSVGDLTRHRYSVRILPPGQELLDEMQRQSEETYEGPIGLPVPKPDSARSATVSDPFGLRGEVLSLRKALAKSGGSLNWSAESKRLAAVYDAASTEILARRHTGELAIGEINTRLQGLDPAVREKWQPTTAAIQKLLSGLSDEGKLPTHDRWVVACQVVSSTLGETR